MSRPGSPKKKRTKGRNNCLASQASCMAELLGIFFKAFVLSLFTAEEAGFLLRCWLGLGSAAKWGRARHPLGAA